MRTFTKYLSICIIAAGLTSCEEFFSHPIDYFVETPAPSLVVNAELTPDMRANVEVSNSTPIFAYPAIPIKWQRNATVVMFEDGVFWDTLKFVPNLGQGWFDSSFVSSKLVKANKNYSIEVNAEGFNSVTGNTNVPETVNPLSFKWVNFPTQVSVRLKPIATGQVYLISFYSSTNNLYFRSKNPIVEFDDDDFIDFGFDEGAFEQGWIRPERMNGQDQTVQIEFVYGINDPHDVYLSLTVVNQDLFNYWLDLKNFDPDNPFNEPVQVQSNIIGGYGIFSAFALSTTQIVF